MAVLPGVRSPRRHLRAPSRRRRWRASAAALSATLAVGAPVNVEADVLVKLAAMQMQPARKPEFDLTEAWLVANGY